MVGSTEQARLVAHVVSQLDGGGSAGGLLNLIRHLPPDRYRHAIVCLHDPDVDASRLGDRQVQIINLRTRSSAAPGLRLVGALRRLRPDVVHTRNLAGLPGQLAAALAGVRIRVHGEYGRDDACAAGYRQDLLRRAARPLVSHFVAVSAELERWLIERIGAEPARISQISNGVDSVQFHPRLGPPAAVGPDGFMRDDAFVIGSVGRMDDANNHTTLVEAFLRLIASPHPAHQRLRLLIVGSGPMRAECLAMLDRAGAAKRAWLPGNRADIPQLLRAMDLFVLPSLAEGSANAVLEAMATGLPVVATNVGGNGELVQPGFTGILVPPMAPDLLAAAISDYCRIPEIGARHGARARSQVIARHSLQAMARGYLAVYDALSARQAPAAQR